MKQNRRAPHHADQKTRLFSPTTFAWLKIVGSAVLFLAWVSQNEFQKNWQEKREELDRLRVRIITNDVLANVWYAAFIDQQARPEIDLIPTASIGLQYINFSHQVLAAAAKWNDGATESILSESQRILDEAKQAQRSGDLSRILDLAVRARRLDEAGAAGLVPENENKYAEIRAQEKSWGNVFNVLYVAGALVIGIAAVGSLLIAASQRSRGSDRATVA